MECLRNTVCSQSSRDAILYIFILKLRHQVFLFAIIPVLQVKDRGVPKINRRTIFLGFLGLARTCGLPPCLALLERIYLLAKRFKFSSTAYTLLLHQQKLGTIWIEGQCWHDWWQLGLVESTAHGREAWWSTSN